MFAIFWHELKAYFNSMVAYVFGAFLLVFTGLGAMRYNINASVANFEYVLSYISIILVVVVPILTMRVIAEEKRQRTDQLLYSLPISSTDVILGKFFALMIVFLVPMLFICGYPLLFAEYGEVYLPTSYGAIVAFFFLGLCLISIGIFISSLTESQGMAAGIGVITMVFLFFCSELADYVSASSVGTLVAFLVVFAGLGLIIRHITSSNLVGAIVAALPSLAVIIIYFSLPAMLEGILPNIMNKISIFERFYTFVNGVFDVTAIVYYVSITVFFLFLSVQSLEKRRYNG